MLIRPEIHEFKTFAEFTAEFELNENDIILTNAFIYEPLNANLPCKVIYQENFGGGEPSDVMVQSIMNEAKKYDCSRVIALGGGTVIDIAKILVLGGCDEIYELYDNVDKLTKDKELVIIPTTCGTGSEVTNLSIVNLQKLGVKKGLASPCMYPDSAVLIPEFIRTLPYGVFAASSIDALIHAIEAYLNPRATAYSDIFAVEAIKILVSSYMYIRSEGKESYIERGDAFLRASNYAGIAFSNSGCATIHAMSYAFGGKYHVAHGESNYQFLSCVLGLYKKREPQGKIAQLQELLGTLLDEDDAIGGLDALLEAILPQKRMSEYGAQEADIDIFAEATFENQQRLLTGSYVPLALSEVRALFAERL